jgi:hypothetical protein
MQSAIIIALSTELASKMKNPILPIALIIFNHSENQLTNNFMAA